jgi:hypothetical protein
MLKDVCVSELTGRGKKCFKTRRAAERAARNSTVKLYAYACRYCQSWHHTHQPNKFKTIAPPSLKTLKRWIANQSKVIAACQRRVDAAEAKHSTEQARAAAAKQKAEQAHREELDAIRKMTDSIRRF